MCVSGENEAQTKQQSNSRTVSVGVLDAAKEIYGGRRKGEGGSRGLRWRGRVRDGRGDGGTEGVGSEGGRARAMAMAIGFLVLSVWSVLSVTGYHFLALYCSTWPGVAGMKGPALHCTALHC